MKRILVVAAIMIAVCGSMPALAQLPQFNPGDVLHAVDLNAIVDHILGVGIPQTISVNCGTGGTIGQALQQAAPGDTIKITGTCSEMVLITKDDITLDGQDSAIIDGGGGFPPENVVNGVINIDGAHRVVIVGLTVQRGPDGINGKRGAAYSLRNVVVQDNADDGIQVDESSTANLTDCTILRNGNDGLNVFRTSSVVFHGTSTSNDNLGDGIAIATASSGNISPGATVLVNHNGTRGILVSSGSALSMQPGSLISVGNNTSDGIGVFHSSSFHISDASAPITVSGNGALGVQVANTSSFIITNSRLNTTGNTGDGVGVFNNSRLSIQQGGTVFSENNTRGVNVVDASSIGAFSGTTLIAQNNRITGLSLTRSSSASLAGTTTVVNNLDDGIDLTSTSSASFSGTTLVEGNGGFGFELNRTSALTVTGTLNILNNSNSGISVGEESYLRLFDGTMVIAGNTNNGIAVGRASSARLGLSTEPFDLQIRNNTTQGIAVNEQSIIRLEIGTVISNNTGDGLLARRNSGIVAFNINVTGNGGNGLNADDSSVEVNNSTISGNTGTDVTAAFAARLTLNGNTIGSLFCAANQNVLSRGSTLCP